MTYWLKRLFTQSTKKNCEEVEEYNYVVIDIDSILIGGERTYIYFGDKELYLSYLHRLGYKGDIFRNKEGDMSITVEGFALIYNEKGNNKNNKGSTGLL